MRNNIYHQLFSAKKIANAFVVIFVILMPLCASAQEEFPKEFDYRWFQILPDVYVGPKGIGVPGALESFRREPREEALAKQIEELKALEALARGWLAEGEATFIRAIRAVWEGVEMATREFEAMGKDMKRELALDAISKILGYKFKDEGRPGGMRVLEVPEFKDMTTRQRVKMAGAIFQMYGRARKEYFLDEDVYGGFSGSVSRRSEMIRDWNQRPEVSTLKSMMHEYSQPVPSYWTYGNRPQSLTEAQTLTETVHEKHRAIIVGKGPEADLMSKNLVNKLGEANVKRIDSYKNDRALQLEAKRFGADVILGIKESKVKGVWIDPKPSKAGKGGSEIRDNALKSKPSGDPLTWPAQVPSERK